MAYNKSTLNFLGAGMGGPRLAIYGTADRLSDVEGAGYFSEPVLFQTGDVLVVVSSHGTGGGTKIYKVTKTASAVTLSSGTAIS